MPNDCLSVTVGQEITGDKKKKKEKKNKKKTTEKTTSTHPQHAVLLNAGNQIKIPS